MEAQTADILDFPEHVAKAFGEILETKANSDVVFVINGTRFPAHRQIVAAQSKFFQVLLFENRFKEGDQTDIPLEAPVKAFELLLMYCYTGKVDLTVESLETTMELYELAHRYEVLVLEEKLRSRLFSKLTVDSVFDFLDFISVFDLNEMETICYEFIDENAQEILMQETFLAEDAKFLEKIFTRETLKATTIQKFQALDKWIKHNQSTQTVAKTQLLDLIDLSKLSNKQILKIVAPTNLYDSSLLFTASRKSDVPEETLPHSVVKFLEPKCVGECTLYSANGVLERGHWVAKMFGSRSIFSMQSACLVNFIYIQLGPSESYKFMLEISIDGKKWEQVYQKWYYHFSTYVEVYVAPRPVKYFRITGHYEIVSFKTRYKEDLKFLDGVLEPSFAVSCRNLLYCNIYGCTSDPSSLVVDRTDREEKVYLTQPLWLNYLRFHNSKANEDLSGTITVTVVGMENVEVHQAIIELTNVGYYYFSFRPSIVTAFTFQIGFRNTDTVKFRLSRFETGRY